MVKFSQMSRGKFAMWALFALVFVVGAFTVVQQLGGIVGHFAQARVTNTKTYAPTGPDRPTDVTAAPFDYLVPGQSNAWKMVDGLTAYDPAHGIVKYNVTFVNAKVNATLTQQVFPDQLKPRGGDKFTAFINNSKPVRSTDVNGGTLYFLLALQNGAPANGTDTVIFARDDVLMFGQSQGILGWDAWTQMIGSLKKHP